MYFTHTDMLDWCILYVYYYGLIVKVARMRGEGISVGILNRALPIRIQC